MKLFLAFTILVVTAHTAHAACTSACTDCNRPKNCNKQSGCEWSGGSCVVSGPVGLPFVWPPTTSTCATDCNVFPSGECCCDLWQDNEVCDAWNPYWGGDGGPTPNDNADWNQIDKDNHIILGWTQTRWDACDVCDWPDSEFKCWECLEDVEQVAAFNLGWGPLTWNDCDYLKFDANSCPP